MSEECLHRAFIAQVDVKRVYAAGVDDERRPDAYSADISVVCAECQQPFRWLGLDAGLLPDRPMCSADGLELRAPLYPADTAPVDIRTMPGFVWASDPATADA